MEQDYGRTRVCGLYLHLGVNCIWCWTNRILGLAPSVLLHLRKMFNSLDVTKFTTNLRDNTILNENLTRFI